MSKGAEMKMEEHELKITIVDLTLIIMGLQAMKKCVVRDFPEGADAVDVCDHLMDKIAEQTRSWGKASPAEAIYMAGVQEILDAAETAPQEP